MSFKKIRLRKQKKNQVLSDLFSRKEKLKLEIENGLLDEDELMIASQTLDDLIKTIDDVITNENVKTVRDNVKYVEDPNGRFTNINAWKLKKKLAPKTSNEAPVAKKDKFENIISDRHQLEKIYIDFYTERMKPNTMREELKELESHKENLFELRLKLAELEKTPDWTMEELEKVLNSLKNNKARDSYGHTYELFKYGGYFLKESLLKMFNKIKNSKEYPDILTCSTLTIIYKGKRCQFDLNSERGIYNLV